MNANNQTSMASVDFMEGFSKTTGMSLPEAREQWEWFSRNLSDYERFGLEQGGEKSGIEMGQEYNRLYWHQQNPHKRMWEWLAQHGLGNWGRCSAESVLSDLVHSEELNSQLTNEEHRELWKLAKHASASERVEVE